MAKLPKHLQERRKKPSTRARSYKQEKGNAADLEGGEIKINSGATFGENDVDNAKFSMEAKTTYKESFSLKKRTFLETKRKCKAGQVPLMQVDFENPISEDPDLRLITMEYQTFLDLLNGDI